MQWSFILIGAAIATAGAVGVFLPPGYRWAVLLPIIAGTGVGIVGLAVGGPEISNAKSDDVVWKVFLEASIAGFVTVVAGLAILVARSLRPSDVVPTANLTS
jgi:multisubunit Na+/H+ antiporter MnhG subunit